MYALVLSLFNCDCDLRQLLGCSASGGSTLELQD